MDTLNITLWNLAIRAEGLGPVLVAGCLLAFAMLLWWQGPRKGIGTLLGHRYTVDRLYLRRS